MDSTRTHVKVFGSEQQAFIAFTTRIDGPIEIKQKCRMTGVGYFSEPISRAKFETRLIIGLHELTQPDPMPNFCGIEYDSPHAISMGSDPSENARNYPDDVGQQWRL